MFLICTAEHSVLWEALCKSLSLYTVNSIASSDSSKVLNVVVKPITKADLSQQKQTLESAQVALVTFPETLICCATALPIIISSIAHKSKDFFMAQTPFTESLRTSDNK